MFRITSRVISRFISRPRVAVLFAALGAIALTTAFVTITRGANPAASVTLSASTGAPESKSTASPGNGNGSGSGTVVAAPGRVEPASEEIDVGIELSGRLREVAIEEGDRVTRGQIIARLESDDHAARLASAEARLALARADLERLINGARVEERREASAGVEQAEATLAHAEIDVRRLRNLLTGGAISQSEVDQSERNARVARARVDEMRERFNTVNAAARGDERRRAEANVRVAQAQVAEARAFLAKTEVRSPIDGVVLRKHHNAGESLSVESPDSIVATIGDLRVLRVRVEVDETDVADLALGQTAWVTADAYGARRFSGRVIRIGETLGQKRIRTERPTERTDTRVLETLVELDPGTSLPIGLRVDSFITRATR
jgi:HlyD family secretion protein